MNPPTPVKDTLPSRFLRQKTVFLRSDASEITQDLRKTRSSPLRASCPWSVSVSFVFVLVIRDSLLIFLAFEI